MTRLLVRKMKLHVCSAKTQARKKTSLGVDRNLLRFLVALTSRTELELSMRFRSAFVHAPVALLEPAIIALNLSS